MLRVQAAANSILVQTLLPLKQCGITSTVGLGPQNRVTVQIPIMQRLQIVDSVRLTIYVRILF
jgi:hypothetical protein